MNTAHRPVDEENVPFTNNLFPPPPLYYKSFTSANIARQDQLQIAKGRERIHDNGDQHLLEPEEQEYREDVEIEHFRLKADLGKPRADWVNDDGRWMCFGQMFTTEPSIPSAASLNVPAFIDPDESSGTSLPPLLHSFLHTFLLLVDALTYTARIPGELEEKGWAHEGDQYVQHMTNLLATLLVSANQLRGVQAEATLVLLMEKQLVVRREQTAALRNQCHSIAKTIRALKAASAAATEVAVSAPIARIDVEDSLF